MKNPLIHSNNKARLEECLFLGRDSKDWYAETFALLNQQYGEYATLVTYIIAATSINSTLKCNVRLARKAFYQISNSLEIRGYLPNIKTQLDRIARGQPLSGRKITNYVEAITGNPNAVVVDVWILRAFGLAATKNVPTRQNYAPSPTSSQYDSVEKAIRLWAREIGIEPRQLQAALWAGVRFKTTGDWVDRYDGVLREQNQQPLFENNLNQ